MGPNELVDIYLYDVLQMEDAVKGLQAELYDCAFPLISRISVTSNKDIAFKDADFIFLCGAVTREPIHKTRKDLVVENSLVY